MNPYYLYANIDGEPRWHLVLAYEDSIDFVKEGFIEPVPIDEYVKAFDDSIAVRIPSVEELIGAQELKKGKGE